MQERVRDRRRSRILVRGAQRSFDPRGALSPTFDQNRVFPCPLDLLVQGVRM